MRSFTSITEVTTDGSAEAPNPKIQISNKSQEQNLKVRGNPFFEIWDLKFVWNLGFGIWNFRFAVVPLSGQ
jgi:hypothetical protein